MKSNKHNKKVEAATPVKSEQLQKALRFDDDVDDGIDEVIEVKTNDFNDVNDDDDEFKKIFQDIVNESETIKKPKRGVSVNKRPTYEDINTIMPAQKSEDKQQLYHKITLYHKFFKQEVKHLKLKSDASVQELQDYIKACDATIMSSSVNNFLQHQILNIIRVVERISAIAGSVRLPFIKATLKCNITSTADKLEQDPEFSKLANLLFIKYNMFNTLSIELQMMFLILKTAMIARVENDFKERSMREFLNQEV